MNALGTASVQSGGSIVVGVPGHLGRTDRGRGVPPLIRKTSCDHPARSRLWILKSS